MPKGLKIRKLENYKIDIEEILILGDKIRKLEYRGSKNDGVRINWVDVGECECESCPACLFSNFSVIVYGEFRSLCALDCHSSVVLCQ